MSEQPTPPAVATNDADAFERLAAWIIAEPYRRASIKLGCPVGAPVAIKVSGWRSVEAAQGEHAAGAYEANVEAQSFGRAWDLLSKQLARLGEP